MWKPEPGMTNWFSSRSRWKTISPVSGHLIQRFCGTSRLLSRLRIFGRTTLLIQLILFLSSPPESARASASARRYVGVPDPPGKVGDEGGNRPDGAFAASTV